MLSSSLKLSLLLSYHAYDLYAPQDSMHYWWFKPWKWQKADE